jgi:hypothetical protein
MKKELLCGEGDFSRVCSIPPPPLGHIGLCVIRQICPPSAQQSAEIEIKQ